MRAVMLTCEMSRAAANSPVQDAIVIGAGPNGLAAAIACAGAGLRITVYEGAATIGGGTRTAAATLPGFRHDLGSSVYPFGAGSPFFRALPIERYGLEWVHPPHPLAHPFDDGDAVVLGRSLDATVGMAGEDGRVYERLIRPLVRNWGPLAAEVLAPVHWPANPWMLARFGINAARSAGALSRQFRTARMRAVIAGLAAHSAESLDTPLTSAFALLLAASAHAVGWPFARGGAQSIADALAGCLRERGGDLRTGYHVHALRELPPAGLTMCDVAPENLAGLAGDRLPPAFLRRLRRFRRSAGAFKIDWALGGPIPWRAQECREAGTVHLGGPFEEIAASELAARQGRLADRPFVILAQPSICDPSRAPAGSHVAWAYCHVPLGSTADMTGAVERQVERFAPGFRDRVLARHVMTPADLLRSNPNLIGGEITGGAFRLTQSLTRPTWRGHRTPRRDLYICSASTPPGAGVHGMCGYWAARAALHDHHLNLRTTDRLVDRGVE